MANEETEGIRLPETEAWIGAHTDALKPPFQWSRLTGGTSNLTYKIEDAEGRSAVVRRPPTGKLLPKAHDMVREHKILAGLAHTDVPIAKPLALCDDLEVTGAPFYVMEFREGSSIADPGGTVFEVPAGIRPRIGLAMVEALAELHSHAPADVSLDDLGRHEAYIARQLDRWLRSFELSHEAAQVEMPGVVAAHEILKARIPDQGPARVCHGDYGPHNILVDDKGEVSAITDWEICTLGDPLADLGYLLRAWGEDDVSSADAFLDAAIGEGHATRRELITHYEKCTGRTLSDVWFYIAFNFFKSACIIQGVYARFMGGVRGTQGLKLDTMRERVEQLDAATTRSLEQL